jgi:hypothetical protein
MPKRPSTISRPTIFDKLLLAASTSRYVDGIWVGSYRRPSDLRRVDDALLLIKQWSPLHYSRVRRDLARIWIYITPGARAHYSARLDACVLDERWVTNSIVEELASMIIHEASHARLEHLGIDYKEEERSRIEKFCFRRQLAFVAKLPDSKELQDELKRSVDWYGGNKEWFSDANFVRREKEGVVEALRYIDAPQWVIRLFPAARSLVNKIQRFCQGTTQSM